MRAPNILFLCSDEHTRNAANCYGSRFLSTPNIDRLAATGTRFTNAYSNSPLCVPARASMISGQYVHRIRCWDNGHPYSGSPPGWAHALRDLGYRTVAIGKNHFRSVEDDNGFDQEILPMHVRNGIGDLYGMLRQADATYPDGDGREDSTAGRQIIPKGPAIMAEAAGRGETNHTRYDRAIAEAACDWLRRESDAPEPWALYVSFVAPHFPLTAPAEFYDLYPHDKIEFPIHYKQAERPDHPVIHALTRVWNFDDYFDDASIRRARAGYYGLISFLDDNIGKILSALGAVGSLRDTVIVYTSDHGEMLGNKGIWSTSALYEGSVGVPLILAGHGIRQGAVADVPVSHVDLLPTLLQIAGSDSGGRGDGHSLVDLDGLAPDRPVLSEYHAGGSITGCYMLRLGQWKYHHYVGFAPELFDLATDPDESRDLGPDPEFAAVRAKCEAALRGILDPDAVNARAFADQAATMRRYGGPEAIRARGHPGEHALDRRLGVE